MPTVDEIKARWEAATPGPWEADVDEGAVATERELVMVCQPYDPSRTETAADMQAIAHAPGDVAWLLTALEAAEKRYAAARAVISRHCKHDSYACATDAGCVCGLTDAKAQFFSVGGVEDA